MQRVLYHASYTMSDEIYAEHEDVYDAIVDAIFDDLDAETMIALYWHVGTYVIINGFLWLVDLTLGDDDLTWAPWVTAAWGLGLAFHVLAYLVQGRQLVARKTEQYLREEPEP